LNDKHVYKDTYGREDYNVVKVKPALPPPPPFDPRTRGPVRVACSIGVGDNIPKGNTNFPEVALVGRL
jgi:hypothetical protein